MIGQLLATIKRPSGNIAIADALMSIQGEFYMIDMPKLLADNIWDTQNVIYLIETNFKQIGKFSAICTGFVPYIRDGKEMARASFVRSEFV
jgi:hypothetical protein